MKVPLSRYRKVIRDDIQDKTSRGAMTWLTEFVTTIGERLKEEPQKVITKATMQRIAEEALAEVKTQIPLEDEL